MKCHPEHLTSEFASLAGLGAREMVNASRHTFTLLSDPLRDSPRRAAAARK
jgi:hypothetical protein